MGLEPPLGPFDVGDGEGDRHTLGVPNLSAAEKLAVVDALG